MVGRKVVNSLFLSQCFYLVNRCGLSDQEMFMKRIKGLQKLLIAKTSLGVFVLRKSRSYYLNRSEFFRKLNSARKRRNTFYIISLQY